jgi:hypothetical protein
VLVRSKLLAGVSACVALGFGAPATAAAAPDGALTQLPAPADCISEGGTVCGVTSGTGLVNANALAVSPDGRNVYVVSSPRMPWPPSPGTL